MRMQYIRSKRLNHRIDSPREGADLAPFGKRGNARPRQRSAVKGQPVDRLHGRRRFAVARPGDGGDLPPHRLLRLQDRAGAKRIAAVERQAVIEKVKDAHDGGLLAPSLFNGASTGSA